LNLIDKGFEAVPAPAIYLNEDKNLVLMWSRNNSYADLEISPDGDYQWFFRNRITSTCSGSDEEAEDLDEEFLKTLKEADWT